jgi:predicted aspartyl protease
MEVPVKIETGFDPDGQIIVIDAMFRGRSGSAPARLVVDTGCAATMLVPELIDLLGYGPRDGQVTTTVSSALGQEHGYILRVSQVSALGFTFSDMPIHVFDLADRRDVDGLLGLDFLRQFNYEVRSAEGRLLMEKLVL